MEFIQKKIKANVYGLKSYFGIPDNYSVWEAKAKVDIYYKAEIITASWGISSIKTVVTHIDGIVEYEIDHDDPQKRVGTIEINASLLKQDWKILDDIKPSLTSELLMVDEVQIDFENKTIAIS